MSRHDQPGSLNDPVELPPLPPEAGDWMPAAEVLSDAEAMGDLFDRAAEACLNADHRQGSALRLPRKGRLIIGGDLHDHGPNFMRLIRLARLHERTDHHLVIQEFVHGPHRVNGRDMSYRLLARAAAMKLRFPNQVHILLANHELAQMGGDNILKDGVSVVESFDQGMEFVFREKLHVVRQGMGRFIRSLLLCVRCDNGLFVSHSLPPPRALDTFDTTVIDRVPRPDDLRSGGPAYHMVWGRNHDDAVAEKLGAAWDAKLFVMGHQPADMGYNLLTRRMLVLASDHEHGMALPIQLRKDYDIDDLMADLIPLASIVM